MRHDSHLLLIKHDSHLLLIKHDSHLLLIKHANRGASVAAAACRF